MTLNELLAQLSERGVNLWADNDQLRVRAQKGALTPELRDSLAEHKAELLLLLHQNSMSASSTALPTLEPALNQRYEPFPLTDMQHAFWVGRSGVLELGNVANHGYYEIEGNNLDLKRLNWALQKLIERHDMLRAVVLPDGQQQVLQQVPPYQIEVLDLRGQEDKAVTAQIEAIRQQMSHQVLPSDRWPLFEFRATRLDGERVRLHISYDLQVFDAWSLFRLFDEWFQLYQNPELSLPPLELSFRDYVLAEQALQDSQLYARSQEYWFSRLDNFPPAPDLPLAKNASQLKQHQCKRYDTRIDRTDWEQLKHRAARAGLTPSGVLLAAFAEILTLWSKSPRFTINLALFNRLPLHPQVNDILGDFTSVTLLAVDNSASESFTNRAIRLQQQLWRDLEHRYFSGVRVVRELARREGRTPSAMPVVFTSTLGFGALGQETSTFSHFGELIYGISQASQAWMDIQVWEEKGTLKFNWDVVEELFPEGLVDDMFEAYCRFLKQLATSESAWVEARRQLLPPAQLAQRDAMNATAAPISDELLHTLFAAQVRDRGHEVAVISSERNLTYQELYERANQVGHRLRQLGATPNQLVGIVMEKGWEQIVAVMGILASGAAYVPIDPELPQERFLYLLENSEADIVLTQSWLNEKLSWSGGVVRLCIDTEELADETKEPLQPVQQPDDLAYVIYTSGSTGLPKGVMITHRNVVNVVVHTNQRFNVGSQDRILALTALNHDLSVYDIFGLLSAGGTIVIPNASAVKDPIHWAELMVRDRVTLWNSVPTMMEMLVDYAESSSVGLPSSLRLAILGGDWLPVSLPNRLKDLVPEVQILSIGGPTETTIWNIGYLIKEVDPSWKSIPYGQPMANAKYYILNEVLEDCPVWVPGQMYCAGVQLAKGYWRNEEKTHANFITHPRTGERIYRTGDLGRYLPDGNIEFLGRVDFQIKIRGHRIEAGEIEAALTQHPGVRSAVVTTIGEQHNKERLVAYIVSDQKPTPTIEGLSDFLKKKLPDYMVPSAFVFLDALPLSANGKVDRRALPTQESLLQKVEVAYVAPQTDIEQIIANIWQELLGVEKVGVNDNFFDLGGNSLLLTKAYSELKKRLSNEVESISLIDLFNYSTIKSLIQHLVQRNQTNSLNPRVADLEQKLNQGKERLKQRLKKSKLASR
jgi:pyochelin synthetase